MTQKEFNLKPETLMAYCLQIYRLEEKTEMTNSTLKIKKVSSFKSFGEIISIEIHPGSSENNSTLIFKSESKYDQAIDWGKNSKNESEFFLKLEKQIQENQQ